MFENRRMPNGTSEPSLGLCGVGGRAREGSLYPIPQKIKLLSPICQPAGISQQMTRLLTAVMVCRISDCDCCKTGMDAS